jgi:hypothetical protein
MAVLGPTGRHRHDRASWPRDGSRRPRLGSTGLSPHLGGLRPRLLRTSASRCSPGLRCAQRQHLHDPAPEYFGAFIQPTRPCAGRVFSVPVLSARMDAPRELARPSKRGRNGFHNSKLRASRPSRRRDFSHKESPAKTLQRGYQSPGCGGRCRDLVNAPLPLGFRKRGCAIFAPRVGEATGEPGQATISRSARTLEQQFLGYLR